MTALKNYDLREQWNLFAHILVQGNRFLKICESDAIQDGDQASDDDIQATIMCWNSPEKDSKKRTIDHRHRTAFLKFCDSGGCQKDEKGKQCRTFKLGWLSKGTCF